jgi:hypothetical protein
MKRALTLVSIMVLALLVPQLVLAQWAEEKIGVEPI